MGVSISAYGDFSDNSVHNLQFLPASQTFFSKPAASSFEPEMNYWSPTPALHQ